MSVAQPFWKQMQPLMTLNVCTSCDQTLLGYAPERPSQVQGKQARGLQHLQFFNPSQESSGGDVQTVYPVSPRWLTQVTIQYTEGTTDILKTSTEGKKKEMICGITSCLQISETHKHKICIFPGVHICKKNPHNERRWIGYMGNRCPARGWKRREGAEV